MGMQIAFSCSVGGVTLHSVTPTAGRCVTDEVSGLSHDMNQLASQDAVIDGDDMKVNGRGGQTFVFRFTGHKWHADNVAAAVFVAAHPGALPVGDGAVAITIGATTIGYTSGVVLNARCRMDDNQTISEYEILCSKSN